MCVRNYSASENVGLQSTFAVVSFHTRYFRCFIWQFHAYGTIQCTFRCKIAIRYHLNGNFRLQITDAHVTLIEFHLKPALTVEILARAGQGWV